jgi:hypothetical protein
MQNPERQGIVHIVTHIGVEDHADRATGRE